MKYGIVNRNDRVWQGHPDVARFKNKLYVIYRESDKHLTNQPTRIMLTSSKDGFTYAEPTVIASSPHRFNCPRLTVINHTMWIICDRIQQDDDFIQAENQEEKTQVLLWYSKNGTTWSKPITTNITGIVPDRICSTHDHQYLIATHTFHQATTPNSLHDDCEKPKGYLIQNVWKNSSPHNPKNWRKYPLAHDPALNLCEASLCKTPHGIIALLRENSGQALPALITQSFDHGETWTILKPTRLFGCHRPVLAQLKSKHYMVTYREAAHSFKPPFWAKNTFAAWIPQRSLLHEKKPCEQAIILPLDHDHSPYSDSGYTGWIQTTKGIYVVNYITKYARKPYITWYLFKEGEF